MSTRIRGEIPWKLFSNQGGAMKPARYLPYRALFRLLPFILLLSFSASAEQLTLKRAVELALNHSPAAGQIIADEQRADASLREARNQYLPQLMIGSGLGDTWGYPLSLKVQPHRFST
jgi:outer membrane protein TolC